jgi:beta-galactosidase
MKRERFNEGWGIGPKGTMMSAFMPGNVAITPVTLPHDAMISGKREPGVTSGKHKGFFPDGQYEYTKRFTPETGCRGKKVFLEFEGVYMNARVFINGEYAGERPYGYSNFYIDAGPFLKYGEENTLKVTLDTAEDSRWYSGAGIYRNVWLITGELSHFALNGVRITTADIGEDYAVIEIENILESADLESGGALVRSELLDPKGNQAALDETPVTLYGGDTTVVRQRLAVKKPRLWDTESPQLYTCRSSLCRGTGVLDTEETTFGIRILHLDTERGLQLNGRTVKLRGACIHHDNGLIGAATFERAEERRAEILKSAGFNALRSAHHPMSKAMLDACDRTGLLVMDEAFDMWTIGKVQNDYSRYFPEWWERDITAMVEKDYNHPCVVLYSIGNEIPDTGAPGGSRWGRKIAEKIRSLDRSRYIINSINGMVSVMDQLAKMREQMQNQTGDINSVMTNMGAMMKQIQTTDIVSNATAESYAVVDVGGYNYMDSRYEKDRTLYPHRVICGSETFPRDIAANWAMVEKMNNLIGDFTWTGWDYLGESGIGKIAYDVATLGTLAGDYPWISAWCGDVDITGNRRPISWYRETVWGLRESPYIAVLKPEYYGKKPVPSMWAWSDSMASWTWPGYEGKPVEVEVYSAADEVALTLDGKEIGRAPAGKAHQFKAVFETRYQPGTLEAISYAAGKESGRCVLKTAGEKIELAVKSDRDELALNRGDLACVSVTLTDKAGTANMAAEKKVSVKVEGAGVLQGFGSGNPVTEESYLGTEHTSFEGRVLAVIRPTEAGTIKVSVGAEGCETKTLAIRVKPTV